MRGSVALSPLFFSSSAFVMRGVGGKHCPDRRAARGTQPARMERIISRLALPSGRHFSPLMRPVFDPSASRMRRPIALLGALLATLSLAACQSTLQNSDSFLGVITPYKV